MKDIKKSRQIENWQDSDNMCGSRLVIDSFHGIVVGGGPGH